MTVCCLSVLVCINGCFTDAPQSTDEQMSSSSSIIIASSSVSQSSSYGNTSSVLTQKESSVNAFAPPNSSAYSSTIQYSNAQFSSVHETAIDTGGVVTIPTIDSLNQEILSVFDPTTIQTFELLLSHEALESMDANPMDEVYHAGSFVAGTDTIHDVEIRYKGSYGAWLFAEAYSFGTTCAHWRSPNKACTKLSIKVKFNTDGNSERRFHGLKKLQFHAMNIDLSQLRDRLGYWVFNQMGVRAPRSVHTKLKINGVLNGLYIMIEQIDGRFTRANFEKGGGNLYKEILPTDGDNDPHSDDSFYNSLKTNEDENPSFDLIRSFAEDLEAADETTIKEVLTKWLDIQEAVTFVAMHRALQHWDSPWSPLEHYGKGKNMFLYEDSDRQKFTLIPWDMDNILHQGMLHPSFSGPVTPEAGSPFPEECIISHSAAQCSNLLFGLTKFHEEYRIAVEKYRDDVFPRALAKLEEWRAQISDATEEMHALHGDFTPGPKDVGMKGAVDREFWNAEVDFLIRNYRDAAVILFTYLD